MVEKTIDEMSVAQPIIWQCGCVGDDHSHCNGSCIVDMEWSFRVASTLSLAPKAIVAALSSVFTPATFRYTFQWSEQKTIDAIFQPTDPTQMGRTMTLYELALGSKEMPDTMLGLGTLARVVKILRDFEAIGNRPLFEIENIANRVSTLHFESDYVQIITTKVEDDDIEQSYEGFYSAVIRHWKKWHPENIIATLFGPVEKGPLKKITSNRLYEFRLSRDGTVTILPSDPNVRAFWYEKIVEPHKLEMGRSSAFNLRDIFCGFQAEVELSAPMDMQEVTALKKCIQTVAEQTVNRLLGVELALPKHRDRVLRCELLALLLRLRQESEEETKVLYNIWLERVQLHAWVEGKLVRVMPTARDTLEVVISYWCPDQKDKEGWNGLSGWARSDKVFDISSGDASELNDEGVYFMETGGGHVGRILQLPQAASPPQFEGTRFW